MDLGATATGMWTADEKPITLPSSNYNNNKNGNENGRKIPLGKILNNKFIK